ncbi:MAG: ABC transporter ATP-binding protein [Clostridia bacterium]|nr:ABC transporter ATP-binding protein [Clostridia bacterium]MBR5742921.1 ABC transporter ATP-binding protein [Clostridia bacterium]
MKPSVSEKEAAFLSFRDVCLRYHTPEKEIEALDRVSFSAERGEFLVLLGPSGCGKTTILSLIAGLIAPSSGEILWNGSTGEKERPRIGYMFQHDALFPWLTLWDNALLCPRIRKGKDREKEAEADTLLEEYGLAPFKKSFPRELSGGMRQRAALIRTLAADPDLLLLDEPFSALDYQTRVLVSGDIAGLIRRTGKTCVMVTHDVAEAISLGDRILILSKRPSSVRLSLPVDIPARDALSRRSSPRFGELFRIIWKEMNDDEPPDSL